MSETAFYRKRLKQVLAERCDRNPRYSVRAFANGIKIDVGTISRVLAGKQIPSLKLSLRLMDGIDLVSEERELFLASVAEAQRERNLKRISPAFEAMKAPKLTQKVLDIDFYRVIADWYHVAIMELTFTENFESSPAFVAKTLGISQAEAALAIDRMLSLELLKKEASGKLVKSEEQLSTADKHRTTAALRKNQRQLLEKAIESLENDPIEERSMTSMTMAIDPEKLPIAKLMIRDFNQALCKCLETGRRKRVYNLQVALYPVQKQLTKAKSKRRNESECTV
jgi:uncharacterized protein (TIGR02147 family)